MIRSPSHLLLFSLTVVTLAVSPAKADCFYNQFGDYVCDNGIWSSPARYGVGISLLIFCIVGIILISMFRKRRRQLAASQIYRMQQQNAVTGTTGNPYSNTNAYFPGAPQPPPQSWQPNSEYPAPPPLYAPRDPTIPPYAPPQGPPPGLSKETV